MDCSCQAPLSMQFSRQEHWSGLSLPPSGDLLNPGIEPASLAAQAQYMWHTSLVASRPEGSSWTRGSMESPAWQSRFSTTGPSEVLIFFFFLRKQCSGVTLTLTPAPLHIPGKLVPLNGLESPCAALYFPRTGSPLHWPNLQMLPSSSLPQTPLLLGSRQIWGE